VLWCGPLIGVLGERRLGRGFRRRALEDEYLEQRRSARIQTLDSGLMGALAMVVMRCLSVYCTLVR
jgi:hypothetical protein